MSTAILDQFIDQLASAVADKLAKQESSAKEETPDRFMGKGETSKYLGISRTTLDRWIKERNFPVSMIGGKYVYKRSEVDKWVEENTK